MKPAKLTMTWHGEEPMIGDYLVTAKGRTAYLILEMIRPVRPGAAYSFKAICERRPLSELAGNRKWRFQWNRR